MSTLIVGDIHGCWDEFRELLDLASIGKGDRIIALGDIVDRGPDSAALLEFFRSQPHAESLQGNHERKHFRSFRGELKPALSQTLAREQIGEQAYPGACEFMASLPEFIELPNALLVHGFFEPGVPVREQRTTVIVGTLSGEFRLQRNYDHPWYELYDGELPIIAGHRDYLLTGRPLVHLGRVFGIDTGCCKGGRLTGLLLPEFRFVSVAARKDYWAEASVSRRNCG
ncbi:MAG: metallophosphoesterase, partial [Verrucomicrobia bacterium]|nr:metallophosphoesterase [Verrucomicrobiota bacterium]